MHKRQVTPAEFCPELTHALVSLHVFKWNDILCPPHQESDRLCCFARITLEEYKASVPWRSRLLGPSLSINCIHPHTTLKTVCNHERNNLEDSSCRRS